MCTLINCQCSVGQTSRWARVEAYVRERTGITVAPPASGILEIGRQKPLTKSMQSTTSPEPRPSVRPGRRFKPYSDSIVTQNAQTESTPSLARQHISICTSSSKQVGASVKCIPPTLVATINLHQTYSFVITRKRPSLPRK